MILYVTAQRSIALPLSGRRCSQRINHALASLKSLFVVLFAHLPVTSKREHPIAIETAFSAALGCMWNTTLLVFV